MEQFIQDIVREAGEAIEPLYQHACVTHTKDGEHDVVTEADMLSNEILLRRIKETYPEHGIVSEELPEEEWSADKEYVWVLDPLDGTKPFSVGWPMFAVMAALEHKGEVVLGAMYFPITREMLFAKKGSGAFLNGQPITTSTRKDIRGSFGMFTTGYRDWKNEAERERRTRFLFDVLMNRDILGNYMWCICMSVKALAEGKIDWLSVGGKWWDCAPSKIILEEAGCMVTNGDGEDLVPDGFKGILAASPVLHPQLCKLLGISGGE